VVLGGQHPRVRVVQSDCQIPTAAGFIALQVTQITEVRVGSGPKGRCTYRACGLASQR
jgi:hypothetical protein